MPTVSFKRGQKYVDGRALRAIVLDEYLSRTDGTTKHTATLWNDGSVSCNCKGWVFNHKKKGDRACHHARTLQDRNAGTAPMIQALHNQTLSGEPTIEKPILVRKLVL